MAQKQFIVIAYDLSNDRRRTKLHKLLLNYGTPVQYSLFECWLTRKDLNKLQTQIRKLVRPRQDHVRIYLLCANCASKVETTTAGEITKPVAVIVV